jgi:hypothetical protein
MKLFKKQKLSIQDHLLAETVSFDTNGYDSIDNAKTQSCLAALTEITSALNVLGASTESEFLRLGEQLQDFSGQSRHISSLYLVATELFGGGKMTQGTDGLQDMLERVNRYLDYCNGELDHNTAILKEVLSITHSIHEPMEAFRKIVKKLSMLGISTRIENSVLGQAGQFINVAEDVTKLSEMIESKAKDILGRSTVLSSMIFKRLQEIFRLQNEHYHNADQILSQMKNCLHALTAKNAQAAVTAREIQAQSEAASRRIGEMVTGMQFHDITRQRIEHVHEAIRNLIQTMETRDGSNIESRLNPISVKAEVVYRTLDLQAGQLTETQSEAVEAVETILENLGGLALNMDEMAHQTRNLVNFTNSNSLSFLQDIENGIRRVVSSLMENSKSSKRIAEAIHSVTDMVNEMGRFIKDIDEIGSEIELVALNGQVGASHLGNEGAALGVIADAIQKISQEARRQIRAVSDSVKAVVTCGDRLRINNDADDAQHVDGMITEMTQDLESLLLEFREAILEVAAKFNEVNRMAEPFADSLSDAQRSVTVHTTFRLAIDRALDSIRHIMADALESLPGNRRPEDLSSLLSLKERYTMQSERRIHQSYLAANGHKCEEAVETETATSSELGDNVELF